jgi:hypothetical protein
MPSYRHADDGDPFPARRFDPAGGFETSEAAALAGGWNPRYVRVVQVIYRRYDAGPEDGPGDGDFCTVELATNEEPVVEDDFVDCVRRHSVWFEIGGANFF